MTFLVPGVEIANHRNAVGIGRPDRKIGAFTVANFGAVSAQFPVKPRVCAFIEQMKIVIRYETILERNLPPIGTRQ